MKLRSLLHFAGQRKIPVLACEVVNKMHLPLFQIKYALFTRKKNPGILRILRSVATHFFDESADLQRVDHANSRTVIRPCISFDAVLVHLKTLSAIYPVFSLTMAPTQFAIVHSTVKSLSRAHRIVRTELYLCVGFLCRNDIIKRHTHSPPNHAA